MRPVRLTRRRGVGQRDDVNREEELRQTARVHPRQFHVSDALRQNPPEPLAGMAPEPPGDHDKARYQLYVQLWGAVDPIPSPPEAVGGIPHKNIRESLPPLQEPVQAWASRKVHYLLQIEEIMGTFAEIGAPRLPFERAYPDLRYIEGPVQMLNDDGKRWYMENLDVDAQLKKLVKFILCAHDGEVRLLGDTDWEEFPVTDGEWGVTGQFTVYHPRFWHCQFIRNEEARHWCRFRQDGPRKDLDLTPAEVQWIMECEENETSYLKFEPDPAAGGPDVPLAEYFDRGTWYFKKGHIVTLAEMFRFGIKVRSCFEMYRFYEALPVFVLRRFHSQSHSPEGQLRRDAKKQYHAETGRWALPKQGPW